MTDKARNPYNVMATLKGFDIMKQAVLEGFPRLTAQDTFRFACHRALKCFNACCGDVNIALTPYDVLRMRTRLAVPSEEFLQKYTISPFTKDMRIPVVLLKMRDDEKRSCPFVSPAGCTIYEDRPWPCRMYPIGLASPGAEAGGQDKEFYFLMHEAPCDGLSEAREWSIAGWMADQGVGPYNEMGEAFKGITLHPYLVQGGSLDPKKLDMFFMACYDQDRFRRFVFESSFLKLYQMDDKLREEIATDDLALLKFGFQWLRFCLFGERIEAIKINQDVLAARRAATKVP